MSGILMACYALEAGEGGAATIRRHESVLAGVAHPARSERSSGAIYPAHRGERQGGTEVGWFGAMALLQLLSMGGRSGTDAKRSGSSQGTGHLRRRYPKGNWI